MVEVTRLGRPATTETRTIAIVVSETVFERLVQKARAGGYTPSLYARLLFEAAWAARCGKATDDPVLAACVEAALGGTAAPAAIEPRHKIRRPSPPAEAVAAPITVPAETAAPIDSAEPVEKIDMPIAAPVASVEPLPASLPAPGFAAGLIRTVKSFAAAGQKPADIARSLGVPVAVVRDIQKGKIA